MSAYRESAREPESPVRTPIPWARVGGAMVATGGSLLLVWLVAGMVIFGVDRDTPDAPLFWRLIFLPLGVTVAIGFALIVCAKGPAFAELDKYL